MRAACLSVALALCATIVPAGAQAIAQRYDLNIPRQSLDTALKEFAHQTGLQVARFSDTIDGAMMVGPVAGDLSVEQALRELLKAGGLSYRVVNDNTIAVVTDRRDSQSAVRAQPGWQLAQANEPAQALGASAGQSSERDIALEEVIVTAQKRAQRLIDVPLTVATLSNETLERAGIDTLLDMSHAVPGLVVSDAGGGFIRYYVRGVGNVYGSSSTALVGVYLDEADVTGSASSQLDLRANDIERVEVLKGPQGTLYGAGSSGGTIRFITRDPQLDRFTAEGDLDVYFTDGGDSSQSVSAVVNVPVVEDVFGLRMVGNVGDLGGWVDQPDAGGSNVNDQQLREVRVKGLWKPLEDLTVKGLVYLHRNEGDGIASSTDAEYQLVAAADPTRRLPFATDFDIYNLTATYEFPSVTVLSSSTYVDNSALVSLSQKYAIAPPPAPLFEALSNNTTDTRVFTQEIRLNGEAGRVDWTAGVFYKDVNYRNRNFLELAMGGEDLGSIPIFTEEQSKSGSLFGDVSYALTERAEIGAGIRYFTDDLTAFDGVEHRDGSFHSVDPRLYFSYGFTPDVRVYVSAAEGFRSGGFNTENGEQTTFDPEKVRSYELGVKAALLERRLSLEAAVFLSDYEDIQMFRLDADNLGSVDNGGDARVKGIDASLDWQMTERLLLQLSGNYTDTEIVALAPGVAAVIEGDPVDYTTEYAGSVAGTYSFSWATGLPGFVRLDYNRLGPSHITDRSVPILYESDVNDLVNARLGLQWNRWTIELYGSNLTSEDRLQDPNGGFGFGARPRPRVLGVRLGGSFE
ncbi:TonB-dependent receptor [Steroidobacter agaridevorans]|uniref:TonB-dependent receptor n=1 Tax=Steroidobacter agaridevorans TaxID=2695856 RepID=A0A829YJA5_9GAMM|nr:TonB-dependent receptor [Steroidobacter agaridevorans]GFE82596.1 TonB-dependent receptor [Steroidobacter agaridevorans]